MKRLAAILACLAVIPLARADDYGGIPERFFALIAKGETSQAIDFLYGTNRWVDGNGDQVKNLKGELAKLHGLVGGYLFNERIVEQKVGAHYAHLIYLVGFERQPLRFEFKVYKPGGDWRFQGVSFDARLTEDIDKLANGRLAGAAP